MAVWSRKSFARLSKTCVFGKKRPTAGRFWKFRSKRIHHLADPRLVCKCVKYGRPEIGKVVRYLPDKKNKSRLALSLSLLRESRPKSAGPVANNVFPLPQISHKSVHFRRSYSRTREHHSNAPQSVSNTRRSFSFFDEQSLHRNYIQVFRRTTSQNTTGENRFALFLFHGCINIVHWRICRFQWANLYVTLTSIPQSALKTSNFQQLRNDWQSK